MASSSRSSFSQILSNSCPAVLVSNELMKLIKDPTDDKDTIQTSSPSFHAQLLTMDNLLMHVKNYIVRHNLYDPVNPLKILLHETELGSLLGKSEFSLHDVKDILLQKFVFPVQTKNLNMSVSNMQKRKLDNLFGSEFSAKRIKGGEENSSDESIHSFQDYETEFVQDSTSAPLSDDNFSVNGLIFAETVDVEYEIEPHTDNSDFSCESDSDVEDMVKNAIITFIAHSSDSDSEYLADGSSDETLSEYELTEEDKWRCSSCFTLNDPRMRCCEVCHLTRVGWLSERSRDMGKRKQKAPARSKRKLSKRLYKNKDPSNYKVTDLPHMTTENLSSQSSCINSTDVFKSPTTLEADKKSTTKTGSDQRLCVFCCAKPADSSIIHGKVGCKICCFKCGNRLFDTSKRCPACRRVIERVVYLYNN